MFVRPPQFGRCQRGRLLKPISVCRAVLGMARGGFSLNTHDKCHSVTPAVPRYPRENFPLPPNREPGPDRDGSVDANADPGRRRVLDPGGSKVRCSGLVFPANLSDRHHRGSRFAGLDRLVHDFYYIDTKAPGLNTVGASTYDWPAFCQKKVRGDGWKANGSRRSCHVRIRPTSPPVSLQARKSGQSGRGCSPRSLTLGVLLGFLDVFLELLLLRIVRVLLQQLLPGFNRAFRIALALPAHDAQVK